MSTAIISWGVSVTAAKSYAKRTGVTFIQPEFKIFANGETGLIVNDLEKYERVIVFCALISKPNDRFMELLLVTDALNRSGVQLDAVIPWLAYSPQDKVFRPGEPLSSKIVIDIINTLPFTSLTVFDIHSEKVLEDCTIPTENIVPYELFAAELLPMLDDSYVCVALDKGGEARSKRFADTLGIPLVSLQKSRDKNTGVVTYAASKEDLRGKKTISLDDYTGSGGTLIKSAKLLKELGATHTTYCLTHVFDNGALERIDGTDVDRIITTNASIDPANADYKFVTVLDIARILSV